MTIVLPLVLQRYLLWDSERQHHLLAVPARCFTGIGGVPL
jgi:hypothetical protein